MKVLLVYPKYPDTFWSFRYALAFTGKKAAFPPLGLLTVAAMLPEEWGIRLRDENVEAVSDKDILWADMVFVSAMLAQQKAATAMIERCRSLGRKTVSGGPMFTADPERFAGLADHLVLGEAELTLPRFLRDLERGAEKALYDSDQGVYCDIMASPIPRWDLLENTMKRYSSLAVQFGKGCPHDCEFCNVTGLCGRTMRLKTAERILDELQAIYHAGWRGSVFFVDDNFIGNRRKVKDVLAAIALFQVSHGYPFQFYTQSDIDLSGSAELIDLMAAAGFFRVFIGIETPEIESLKGANKHRNVGTDMSAAVRRLLGAGIQVQGGFVLGFDQDTGNTPKKMVDLIQGTGVMTAMVGTLQALPGTKLFKRLAKEGRLFGKSTGDNTDGSVGFEPKGMTRKELTDGYRRVVSAIYSPDMYHDRLRRFLGDYHPSTLLRHRPSWGGLRAFILSIIRIGIGSRARKWYWKSLFESLFGNRSAFPAVVEHWIFWFHFDRVARKTLTPES